MPAEAKIQDMSCDDQDDGKRQEPEFIFVPDLFGHQEGQADNEHEQGDGLPVVPPITVPQGAGSYEKGQQDHSIFKNRVVDDIDTQYRETGYCEGQDRTVNGAYDGGGDAQGIPIDFSDHIRTDSKYTTKRNAVAKSFVKPFLAEFATIFHFTFVV